MVSQFLCSIHILIDESHSYNLALQQTPGEIQPEHLMKYNELEVGNCLLFLFLPIEYQTAKYKI